MSNTCPIVKLIISDSMIGKVGKKLNLLSNTAS